MQVVRVDTGDDGRGEPRTRLFVHLAETFRQADTGRLGRAPSVET